MLIGLVHAMLILGVAGCMGRLVQFWDCQQVGRYCSCEGVHGACGGRKGITVPECSDRLEAAIPAWYGTKVWETIVGSVGASFKDVAFGFAQSGMGLWENVGRAGYNEMHCCWKGVDP